MYTITLPALPPTLNMFFSRRHWTWRKRQTDEWVLAFGMAYKAAKLPDRLNWPVTVSATLYSKRQPRDTDSAIIAVKFAQDALVEYGYLPNDTPQYIPTVILSSKKSEDGEDKMVIQIL
jgi:hypothetical protein